jgi:hypothetical protein
MAANVKRPALGKPGASGIRSAVKQIDPRNNTTAPPKQAARVERARIAGIAQRSAEARKPRARANYFAQHRPTGDTLRALLGRSQPDVEARPKPSLARVRWLELPFHTEGGRS